MIKKIGNRILKAVDEETKGSALFVNIIVFLYILCVGSDSFANALMMTVSVAMLSNIVIMPLIDKFLDKGNKYE